MKAVQCPILEMGVLLWAVLWLTFSQFAFRPCVISCCEEAGLFIVYSKVSHFNSTTGVLLSSSYWTRCCLNTAKKSMYGVGMCSAIRTCRGVYGSVSGPWQRSARYENMPELLLCRSIDRPSTISFKQEDDQPDQAVSTLASDLDKDKSKMA